MSLATFRVRRQWNRLGKTDPFWGVLSLGEKRGGAWDADEFFRTGRDEIEALMARARTFGLPLRRERALDFGCGVGRLTQALCGHFASCVGLDIAASMLDQARRWNRFPDRCRYELNRSPRLASLGEGGVSLVYTTLVLQHNPPEASREYLRALIRVLEWGGLLVFQLPSQPFPCEADAEAARTLVTAPLSPEDMRARVTPAETARRMTVGETTALKLRVENQGGAVWPSLASRSAKHRIQVGGHWLTPDGEVLRWDHARADLPRDVPPGDGADLFLLVDAPPAAGDYVLELDLVQERVAWFGAHGGATARVAVSVAPTPGAPSRPPPAASLRWARPGGRPPFRSRHPRAYAWLETARVAWAWRVAREAVLAGRAAARRSLLDSPRLSGLRNLLVAPTMEMHGSPKSEVVELIERGGGTLLWAEDFDAPRSGWKGYRYWVTRWPGRVRVTPAVRPLDARIEVRSPPGAVRVAPGGGIALDLAITNAGAFEWPAPGPGPVEVRLGAHALDEGGTVVERDLFRACLPRQVPPGESVDFEGTLNAPKRAGRYVVRLDMLVEGLCWFAEQGSTPADLAVEVTAETPESTEPGLLSAVLDTAAVWRSLHAAPGATLRIPVRVSNTGNTVWLHQHRPGGGQVQLGGHLLDEAGRTLEQDLFRTALPGTVPPGASVELEAELPVPPAPGRYVVALDMVDEGIAWFESHGSPTLRLDLTVG